METAKDRLQKLYKELIHKEYIEKKEDLAPFLGFSVSYTSQMFFGEKEITDKFCERIFTKIGIGKEWIMNGGEMPHLKPASSIKPDNPENKPRRPLITASTPSIDFEFQGDVPTSDEITQFMNLALAKMERELEEKITEKVKKDIIDGLTKK